MSGGSPRQCPQARKPRGPGIKPRVQIPAPGGGTRCPAVPAQVPGALFRNGWRGSERGPSFSLPGCGYSQLRAGVGRRRRDAESPACSARGAGRPFCPARPGHQGWLPSWRPGGRRVNTHSAGAALGGWLRREKRKINQTREPSRPSSPGPGGRRHWSCSLGRARAPRAQGASQRAGRARTEPVCGSPGALLGCQPRPAGPLRRDRALLCSFRWPSTIVLLEIMNSIPIKGH